jgi:HPt (histidine-containing phosphotransfer) domain-containing protein
MTGAGDPSIAALLAAARSQFAAGLPARMAALDGFVEQGAWQEARRAAHKLRGAAATYGYAAVGQCAGAIEDALLEAGDEPGSEARASIADKLIAARTEAARAADDPT